jgi:hypothetical protein
MMASPNKYAGGRYGKAGGGRYGKANGTGDGVQTLIWGGLIVLLVALVGTAVWTMRDIQRADAIDEATLCPVTGATGTLAVLLDLTDPISRTQVIALRAFLDERVAESPRGTLISVGIVNDQPEDWGAAIALCRPMAGDEAGELMRNPGQVDQRYREAFLAPLQAQIEAMLAVQTAAASPIMEALQALIASSAAMSVASAAPREIVLVSDLLQHSDVLSFYRGHDWDSFRAGPHYGRLARNLDGATVTIVKVPRVEPRIDIAAVDDFWVRYLESQGTERVRPRVLGDL